MAPKYKGDSEDWLDSEEEGLIKHTGVRPKKAAAARSLALPPEDGNAVVAEVFPNQCRVWLDADGSSILCSYRRAEVVGKAKREHRERTPVAVGDRVLVKKTGSTDGQVEGICVRRNCISRPSPGRDAETFQHILAANIDFLVIVASTMKPEFSPGLIDRFLIGAEVADIPIILCVSKIDLQQAPKLWEIYEKLGYPVIEVSAKQKTGVKSLSDKIEGKTVVFCGQSGVGKTSLLRALLGSEIGKVGEVSEATGKGKHTTTGAVLIGGPHDSRWIDTPGIKEFGLLNVKPENLAQWFPELKNLACPQKGCIHLEEEGCLAKELFRYSSYRRIHDSLLSGNS